MDDLDVRLDVARGIIGALLGPAQVHDPDHAVISERSPAVVGQAPDVVRSDHGARSRGVPVLGGDAAQVANVDATIPRQRPPAFFDHDRPMVSASPAAGRDLRCPAMASLPDLPRVRLLDGRRRSNPCRACQRPSEAARELWIKREDLGLLAFSGSKVRNLEFLLGAAIADGADTVITSGRRWSNHCRLTAAAGARLGLRVHVVVSGPPIPDSVNVWLMRELGTTVHEAETDDRTEREALVARVVLDAERSGRRTRVLPVGGSEPVGAWGQVLAALEVLDQAAAAGFRPDAIVVPTATGGTQAGLIVGASLARDPEAAATLVTGSPSTPTRSSRPRSVGSSRRCSRSPRLRTCPAAADVVIDRRQLGDGYGIPTPESVAAARMVARSEGIFVDPIYTAKAWRA